MKPFTIGDVSVTSIIERDGPWRAPAQMLPTSQPEQVLQHLGQLEPFVYDQDLDLLVITYQTFVVRTPHHTILIDTCVGEDKLKRDPKLNFSKKPWLDAFLAQGLAFEDIDFVFCTHLHVDHCGWNTRLIDGRWVPTFPNAKYIFSRREYEYWAAETEKDVDPPGMIWVDSCQPVVEAGQALLVEDDYELEDGIWLTPTPGHTPGHVCVNFKSKGDRAIFTGDLMHHALQVIEPDWSSCFCYDPIQSAQSRKRVLDDVADADVKIVPCHFPGPTAGRVVGNGDGWRFRFLED